MQVKSECRHRMHPADRRQEILDAALRVFALGGFRQASLNEVARAAGVTKGCVYHHFASKEELLLALIKQKARPDREAPISLIAASSASHPEKVAQMVDELWRHFQQPGQLELMMLAVSELPYAPDIARLFFDEVVMHCREQMRAAMQLIYGDVGTDAPSEREIELIARLVPSLIFGAALGQRTFAGIDPTHPSPDEVKGLLTKILVRGT